MKLQEILLITCLIFVVNHHHSLGARSAPLIIDHRHTNIWQIPEKSIVQAKDILHIAYGHTSHGSQLISGMGTASGTQLDSFMTANGATPGIYLWHDGPIANSLDLDDYAMAGDVGYYPDWRDNTLSYLGPPDPATGRGTSHADVNVIIWSWCGQAASLTEQSMLDNYLTPMSQLELQYPAITFVYMTGHLDGSGLTGNLYLRNQQIRNYCRENNKVLYDFADIESYDPDGLVNYMALKANDNCDYDSDDNGSLDKNWAIDWQNSHTEGLDWWPSGAAHSQDLNGNRKGYAAWWLWASLAGWDKKTTDLITAITGLQVTSGLSPDLSDLSSAGKDVDGDNCLGLPEAMSSLYQAAMD